MNWYVAKIIFRITSGSGQHRAQFDEHLRLINAWSFEEALLKSRALGIRNEDAFPNDRLDTVRWEFVNVAEVVPVESLADGAELYSRIKEVDEADAYIQQIHQRAAVMQLEERPVF